jgi:hypothetical protein
MSDEKKQTNEVQKVKTIDAGKAIGWKDGEGRPLREGVKPSAPANLSLPRPVAIPVPPAQTTQSAQNNSSSSDKK